MASAQSPTGSVVPRLMETVKRLTPAELRDFKRRFATWQQVSGERSVEDAALVKACQARLSTTDERQLRILIGKSERGALRPAELEEYRRLVRRAESLDATRLSALTQLVSRWGKPVNRVMEIIGWESGDDAATCHPASAEAARARPRR